MTAWRRSSAYRRWRVAVLARDGCCVFCSREDTLQAHHLEDGSHNPDLRYSVDNGVALCRGCHTALHTMYKKSFREKCTQDDFINALDFRNQVLKSESRQIYLNKGGRCD
jgi:hypothetical protein